MSELDPKLTEYFSQYAEDHRHPTNRLTHKLAIPAIVFHVVVMLNWIELFTLPGFPTFYVTVGQVFLVFMYGFYFSLNKSLTLMMVALTLPLLVIGHWFATWFVVAVALIGWGVQLAGHYIWEKNSPSFTTNLVQSIIGPFFFLAVLTGIYKPDPALNESRE